MSAWTPFFVASLLAFVSQPLAAQTQNNPRLIDVTTLQQLNAIRWDVDGDGIPVAANASSYSAAFATTCTASSCNGYELLNDLDFNTASPSTRSDDLYWNDGLGWEPMNYGATFDGNGHVIFNLYIANSTTGIANHGLFGQLREGGVIRGVGLVGTTIKSEAYPTGVLAGATANGTTVTSSYAVGGSVVAGWGTGGLVGFHNGVMVACYAAVAVTGTSVGSLAGSIGGIGRVIASYGIGRVRTTVKPLHQTYRYGGLIGSRDGWCSECFAVNSYYDTDSTGVSHGDRRTKRGLPKTTSNLQTPVSYDDTAGNAGQAIYADWNVDVSGDGVADDPWDFGTITDYPVLRGSDANVARQVLLQPPLTLAVTLTGAATVAENGVAEYTVRVPIALPYAATAHWSVFATAETGMAASGDFGDGAGTQLARFPAGSAVIPAGGSTTTFSVYIFDDQEPEIAERFSVRVERVVYAGARRIAWSTGNSSVVASAIELSDGINYNLDGDRLIDVKTASQLSAISYDLRGRGLMGVSAANRTAYLAAFDVFSAAKTCPSTCTGYELLNDIDLSSAGNWTPIGGGSSIAFIGGGNPDPSFDIRYEGTFEGNGHVIRGLRFHSAGWYHVGLFRALGAEGVIRNVGLSDVDIVLPIHGGTNIGSLVGHNSGKVAASYALGRVEGDQRVGGLVGDNAGEIIASYAGVDVRSDRPGGGLVGRLRSGGRIIASYALGRVTQTRRFPTGGNRFGGLVGEVQGNGQITNSYSSEALSGLPDWVNAAPAGTLKTRRELHVPTGASGIFAAWTGLNIAGVAADPWDFGQPFEYPALRGVSALFPDGNVAAIKEQRQRHPGLGPAKSVSLSGRAGSVEEGSAAEYTVELDGSNTGTVTVTWLVEPAGVGAGRASSADFERTDGAVVLHRIRSAVFQVMISVDDMMEPVESFRVRLNNVHGDPHLRLSAPTSVVNTIALTAESASLSGPRGPVAEGSPAAYAVELHGGSNPSMVTINWSVELTGVGTGHAVLTDFETTRGTVTIPAKLRSAAFQVMTKANETVREPVRMFRVRLSDLRGGPAGLLLSASSAVVSAIASQGEDYDADGDGLIDVTTMTQLNAMRYDVSGAGIAGVPVADAPAYTEAFAFFDPHRTCPDGCTGYELLNDLDFNTASPSTRSDDLYWNDGLGWEPVNYGATFDGNGHVVSNLYIANTASGIANHGLFGQLSEGGVIRGVGLVGATVESKAYPTGVLAGATADGTTVTSSYAVGGSVVAGWGTGGLVGYHRGVMVACYAAVAVTGTSVGSLAGSIGGIGRVIASYGIGRVRTTVKPLDQTYRYGGLIGNRDGWCSECFAVNSYYDTDSTGVSHDDRRTKRGLPKTTRNLQTPVGYDDTAGNDGQAIYADWNVDVSGDGVADDPWDFGTFIDYPVLRGAVTANVARQFALQPQVTLMVALAGAATVFEGDAVEYTVSAPGALRHAATAHWSVVATTETGMAAAGDFGDGAATQLARFPTGTAVIPAGSSATTFSVYVFDDQDLELAERFTVRVERVVDAGGRVVWITGTGSVVTSAIELSDGTDHDLDGDGLIDVATTSQLSAIRHDLSGRGLGGVSSTNRAAYLAAFDVFDVARTCHDSGKGECVGYELSNDVDLSSVGFWQPIGGGVADRGSGDGEEYAGVFEGNGFVISSMSIIDLTSILNNVGLFGVVSTMGEIRNVGLRDVRVDLFHERHRASVVAGALAGINRGRIAASYVVGGSVKTGWGAGGLVATNEGTVIACYANVEVVSKDNRGTSGGLMSYLGGAGVVSASYSIGQPTASGGTLTGGLAGARHEDAEIQGSYFDSDRSGLSSCCGGSNQLSPDDTPQTSVALSTPTAAAGIYAGWDQLNVNDVDENNDGDFNDDAPWDFGTFIDYPVLRGADAAVARRQFLLQDQEMLVVTLTGAATAFEGEAAQYTVRAPYALPYAATVRWSVATATGANVAEAGDFADGTGMQLAHFPTGTATIPAGSSATTFSVHIFDDEGLEYAERFSVSVEGVADAGARIVLNAGSSSAIVSAIELSDGINHNLDGDGLIDVATTSQLSAIRHDLGGRGLMGVSAANRAVYLAAFDVFDVAKTCPDACTGYELSNALDLSSAGDWTPIGWRDVAGVTSPPGDIRYEGTFEGNGYVIRNLRVPDADGNGGSEFSGLFSALGAGGVIRNVGLAGVAVGGGRDGEFVGSLAGHNYGKVAASYTVGGRVEGGSQVGGLVGENRGKIVASYADVHVTGGSENVGGLVGRVGSGGDVIASYALGRVERLTIAPSYGGLAGSVTGGQITNSYYVPVRSGANTDGAGVPATARREVWELYTPTSAAGIFAEWDDLDVDDTSSTVMDVVTLNDDAPWDFGGAFDYPVLVFGGATDTRMARRVSQQETQPEISLAPTFGGSATVSEGATASYVVSLPVFLPAGVTASWDWSVGGKVGADDFVGVTAGSVVIRSGASSASFSLVVRDDTVPELSEAIVVALSNARLAGAPEDVTLGVPVSVRTTIEASDEIDYDADGDDLIEVATTSQLAAIGYDLGGVGLAGVSSANEAAYWAAFPFFDKARTCRDTCTGYELSADLDLSSVEPHPDPGWTPLGGGVPSSGDPVAYYTAVFEGNGRVISNLRMIRSGRWMYMGLFGAVSASATIRNVGLRNARLDLGSNSEFAGALVGRNEGTVAASYVSGGRISGGSFVGGLIGGHYDKLVASYADVEVHAEVSNKGGLIGEAGSASVVSASYSVGVTTGTSTVGGLIGSRDVGAAVESSYFDAQRSGQGSCCGSNKLDPDYTSKTSNQLRVPVTATGIYAGWDRLNVDGVDQRGDGDSNDDSPWDFGSVFDYPVLVFGGATETRSARRTSQQQAQPGFSLVPTLAGGATVSEGGTASYVVRLPLALPAGTRARWDWAVGGEVDADDFVGATASSVVIESGAVSASFSLTVFDDAVPELFEVIVVTLSNAVLTGAPDDVRLGVPSSAARTTIAASDLLPVTVAAASATVSENTTATFTITLHGGGDRAVVVEYEIAAASAGLTPEDLSAVNVAGRAAAGARSVVALPLTGSVVLNATGTATIKVGVASDGIGDEGRERFRLRLTGCPNCITEHPAELGTPSFADVGIRRERTIVMVDARAYLQGALLPGSRRMRSDLVNLLPRRQPYGAFPWNHPAMTTVPHVGAGVGLAGVTSTIVDWVLMELRAGDDAAAAASSRPTTGGRAAGLLLRDGRVAGVNEAAATVADAPSSDGVRFEAELSVGDDLYVLIHHRNHLPVMSAVPVVMTTGDDCAADYCVDFRVAQSHGDGQVEVGAGAYAMVAGDLDRNGVIDERDEVLIRVRNLTWLGALDYRDPDAAGNYAVDADLDFDGEVLSADRYFVIENQGRRRVFSVQ